MYKVHEIRINPCYIVKYCSTIQINVEGSFFVVVVVVCDHRTLLFMYLTQFCSTTIFEFSLHHLLTTEITILLGNTITIPINKYFFFKYFNTILAKLCAKIHFNLNFTK